MSSRRYRYIVFPAQGKAGLSDEEELGALAPGHVRMRTRLSLISPGTELAFFTGIHSSLRNVRPDEPRCAPGYSAVGVIEEVGDGVGNLKVGERIYAETGHVSVTDVPSEKAWHIPDAVADEDAVFTTLLGIALHGVRRAAPQFGENVLVMGLGAIGQAAVRLLRLSGVDRIFAADIFPMRRELALKGGADFALAADSESLEDEVKKLTGGRGCEIVVDATGNPKAINSGLRCAAKGGRVVLLGSPHGEATLDLYSHVHKREVALIGAYNPNCPASETMHDPWCQSRNFLLILDYMRRKKLDLSGLVTHRGSYRNPQPVYDALCREKNNALAAMIEWRTDENN